MFLSFRGADLRNNFIDHLKEAFKLNNIRYYIDELEHRGENLTILFQRIKESRIALVFFSIRYPESAWCLDELVVIMEKMKNDKLRVIPIFFKVKPEDVRGQKKEFGVALYGEGRRRRENMPKWEDALEAIPPYMGLVLDENRSRLRTQFLFDLLIIS